MYVLGLESSCDETAAALYQPTNGMFIERVARQFATHAPYGGVVPELASRRHLETIDPLVAAVCGEAGIGAGGIDLVCATAGPGLAGALLVGLCYGKALASALEVPFIAVNHIEAHVYAACAERAVAFPFIALVVSGGHTLLLDVEDAVHYSLLGRTRDDAAGEAFDKGAKILGLGYPGGQALSALAETGNADAVAFPRAMMTGTNLDFSFSGLKTALLYYMRDNPGAEPADVAASYQEAIVDVLVGKAMLAVEQTGRKRLVVGGGVIANQRLRAELARAAAARGVEVYLPSMPLCTDNARMIAYRGWVVHEARGGDAPDTDVYTTFDPRNAAAA